MFEDYLVPLVAVTIGLLWGILIKYCMSRYFLTDEEWSMISMALNPMSQEAQTGPTSPTSDHSSSGNVMVRVGTQPEDCVFLGDNIQWEETKGQSVTGSGQEQGPAKPSTVAGASGVPTLSPRYTGVKVEVEQGYTGCMNLQAQHAGRMTTVMIEPQHKRNECTPKRSKSKEQKKGGIFRARAATLGEEVDISDSCYSNMIDEVEAEIEAKKEITKRQNSFKGKCNVCNLPGHRWRDCRYVGRDTWCKGCGGRGHLPKSMFCLAVKEGWAHRVAAESDSGEEGKSHEAGKVIRMTPQELDDVITRRANNIVEYRMMRVKDLYEDAAKLSKTDAEKREQGELADDHPTGQVREKVTEAMTHVNDAGKMKIPRLVQSRTESESSIDSTEVSHEDHVTILRSRCNEAKARLQEATGALSKLQEVRERGWEEVRTMFPRLAEQGLITEKVSEHDESMQEEPVTLSYPTGAIEQVKGRRFSELTTFPSGNQLVVQCEPADEKQNVEKVVIKQECEKCFSPEAAFCVCNDASPCYPNAAQGSQWFIDDMVYMAPEPGKDEDNKDIKEV